MDIKIKLSVRIISIGNSNICALKNIRYNKKVAIHPIERKKRHIWKYLKFVFPFNKSKLLAYFTIKLITKISMQDEKKQGCNGLYSNKLGERNFIG